jgi:hypothetical protein
LYTRDADDVLVCGTEAEAIEQHTWVEQHLRDELQLELSAEKNR